MRILIYDKADADSLCKMIEELPYGAVVDQATGYEDCMAKYKENIYDDIFIDFTDEEGSKFLNYVINDNPKQKIITLSDRLICSETKGCDYCRSHYNKIGLMKPVYENDLVYALSDVSFCQKFIKYGNLINTIKDLDREFENFIFDPNTNTFINQRNYLEDREKDLEAISKKLSQNGIAYKIDRNENVIIEPPE